MKQIAIAFLIISLAGFSTVKKYWPRAHDPVMFNHLVELDRILESVDCEGPDWGVMEMSAAHLAKYAEWRQDPQAENVKGLHAHTVRMARGGSKTFCELGKKTAAQRIQATRSAWEGR
jgi:hypothetical protein